MQVKLYNQKAESIGTIEAPDSVFGLPWNADLVHQVVVSQEANRRPKVAHVKDRSEVRGGGKKPWRQKGTGRARHGSIRSPIWKGGGVTHGPTKELDYAKKINKKMAKKALYTVLSAKTKEGKIVVVAGLNFQNHKTKAASLMFRGLAGVHEKINKGNGVLVALTPENKEAKRALRNLPYVGLIDARSLTAWDLLQYRYFLIPKSVLAVFK